MIDHAAVILADPRFKAPLGIFVFDKEGRFKNEIGRRGNGPGEYFYIDNFYLDRKNKLVCLIFNAKKQILQYDYDGNYVSTLHFDENDMNIESVMMCGEDEFLGAKSNLHSIWN